jgi:hypothetical protein
MPSISGTISLTYFRWYGGTAASQAASRARFLSICLIRSLNFLCPLDSLDRSFPAVMLTVVPTQALFAGCSASNSEPLESSVRCRLMMDVKYEAYGS